MADISVAPKKSGLPTWAWALAAIVCVVALMIWLGMQEGSTSPTPVVEEDTTSAEMVADTLPTGAAVVDTTAPQ
jgi:hypothetical protein